MAHQYLNDGEEEEVRSRPAEEPESMTGAPEETPAAAEASSAADESSTSMAPRRQRRSKSESESSQGAAEATTEATTEATPEVAAVSPREADLQDLEARGFTEDEATRLIELSARINEATLKRLQFTKWLVEQGLLDEFSLRD